MNKYCRYILAEFCRYDTLATSSYWLIFIGVPIHRSSSSCFCKCFVAMYNVSPSITRCTCFCSSVDTSTLHPLLAYLLCHMCYVYLIFAMSFMFGLFLLCHFLFDYVQARWCKCLDISLMWHKARCVKAKTWYGHLLDKCFSIFFLLSPTNPNTVVTSLHRWNKQGINRQFVIENWFDVTLHIVNLYISKQC